MKERKLTLEDNKGNEYKKVNQLDDYPGVFIDNDNELHDLRPKDSCPCKTNLEKKPIKELALILKKCYEQQLKQLKQSIKDDKYFVEIGNTVAQRLRKLSSTHSLL